MNLGGRCESLSSETAQCSCRAIFETKQVIIVNNEISGPTLSDSVTKTADSALICRHKYLKHSYHIPLKDDLPGLVIKLELRERSSLRFKFFLYFITN